MTSQSPPANVIVCESAMPDVSNAMFNRDRAVRIISALGYQKTASISNRVDINTRAYGRDASGKTDVPIKVNLTRHVLLLTTRNVFAYSTCFRCLDCIK